MANTEGVQRIENETMLNRVGDLLKETYGILSYFRSEKKMFGFEVRKDTQYPTRENRTGYGNR